MLKKNLTDTMSVSKALLYILMFLLVSGCSMRKGPPPPKPAAKSQPAAKQPTKTVDTKAQQQFYDRGLQLYSKESYRDAQSAFQQVIELGPNTVLGQKAQENLKKIQQILKTLDEMGSK